MIMHDVWAVAFHAQKGTTSQLCLSDPATTMVFSTFILILYSSLHVTLLLPWEAVAWVARIVPASGRQRLFHHRHNNNNNIINGAKNYCHPRVHQVCPSSTTSLLFSSSSSADDDDVVDDLHTHRPPESKDTAERQAPPPPRLVRGAKPLSPLETSNNLSYSENTPEISNLSALEQQLKQIQRLGLDERTLPSKSSPYDEAMAEWEELERRIHQEEGEQEEISDASSDNNNRPYTRDIRGPLPSIIEEARERRLEEKAILDTLFSSREYSSSANFEALSPSLSNFDEANLPPGAIPSKSIISDFEVTPDGGIQLSPEAYRQACQNAANPDGSLNLRSKDGPQQDARTIFSPSVLETVTAKPMAPYGQQQSHNNQYNSKEITIEDLTKQARQARERLEQNPQAQEELHRRIMAEAEEEEDATTTTANDDYSKLFQEALLDPQKAFEFWNQEYLETKKADIEALERSLEEKMKLFAEIEQQQHQPTTSLEDTSSDDSKDVSSSSKKQAQDDNRGSLFVTEEQQRELEKMIEQERLQRARSIARYYNNGDDDWYGDFEKEMKIPNKEKDGAINNEQEMLGNEQEANIVGSRGKGEWMLVEDPTTSDDPFYWNSVTDEMRWDMPIEDNE